ncbi:hypothetical protein GCM10007304_17590 [Rhodococcoides trifolii]|uniref:Uncharacterized protein n=1 Tax=Rhodococcoides trifolii TaxID=908250 RepID=A0A917CYU8_9NOCA|nr:hypothetical protein [Rhodococcus trifolii]GGG03929.1 hypothetical protein GCM10007304_17590 [Rhodococcus trifolii]
MPPTPPKATASRTPKPSPVEDVDASSIPDDLQFTSSVPDAEALAARTVSFKIDNQVLKAVQPTKGALTLLRSSLSSNATESDRIWSVINFFNVVLTPESKEWLNRYINSPRFDDDVLGDVMTGLATHWGAEDLLGAPDADASKGSGPNRAQRRAAAKDD